MVTSPILDRQGSGVGPTFYIVMESDLRTLSSCNVFSKLADDTSLLLPSDSDVGLAEEFSNVKNGP